jgi:hypothetical protein
MRRTALLVIPILVFALMAVAGCERVTVEGSGGRSLSLTMPANVDIVRGRTETVEVYITRKNTTAPVTVSISQLPSGVTVRQPSRTVETDSVAFILEANNDATLVKNQAVAVTIEGPDGMRGTDHFNLSVNAR